MPRTTADERSGDASPGRSLTAASVRHPGLLAERRRGRRPRPIESWQSEVWGFYDEIGEFRYSLNWVANVCSRAEFYVQGEDGTRDDGDLQAILDEVTGGIEGQPEFIRMAALHLTAVGEFYIVNRQITEQEQTVTPGSAFYAGNDRTDVWEVVGVTEIVDRDGTWILTYDSMPEVTLGEEDIVVRVWRPHPKNRFRADCAAKAALPILRRIRRYGQHIDVQLLSRLTGNGMLFLPSEVTVKVNGVNESLTAADLVTLAIGDGMMDAVDDPTSPESQVPVVVTVPGASIAHIKHLQFWSPLDDKASKGTQEELGRLATTMDLPKEVVTGTGDMNRWGAWQVEESSVKVHIEPTLNIIRAALTVDVLRVAAGPSADGARVMADTSTLRLRPNRSKEAIELSDRGMLGDEATLRETGFNPATDGMKPEEFKRWALRQMLKASWSPAQAQAAAGILGIDLGIPIPEDNVGREARPDPSLEGHPVQREPEKSVSDGSLPVAASLAWRAMERAGNRLKTLSGRRDLDCPATEVHLQVPVYEDSIDDLLKDSFACAGTFGIDPQTADKARRYCRRLLLAREPFHYENALLSIKELV